MEKDKELKITGIEVAGLVAVVVIVLILGYVSVTGVGRVLNKRAAVPAGIPASSSPAQEAEPE